MPPSSAAATHACRPNSSSTPASANVRHPRGRQRDRARGDGQRSMPRARPTSRWLPPSRPTCAGRCTSCSRRQKARPGCRRGAETGGRGDGCTTANGTRQIPGVNHLDRARARSKEITGEIVMITARVEAIDATTRTLTVKGPRALGINHGPQVGGAILRDHRHSPEAGRRAPLPTLGCREYGPSVKCAMPADEQHSTMLRSRSQTRRVTGESTGWPAIRGTKNRRTGDECEEGIGTSKGRGCRACRRRVFGGLQRAPARRSTSASGGPRRRGHSARRASLPGTGRADPGLPGRGDSGTRGRLPDPGGLRRGLHRAQGRPSVRD